MPAKKVDYDGKPYRMGRKIIHCVESASFPILKYRYVWNSASWNRLSHSRFTNLGRFEFCTKSSVSEERYSSHDNFHVDKTVGQGGGLRSTQRLSSVGLHLVCAPDYRTCSWYNEVDACGRCFGKNTKRTWRTWSGYVRSSARWLCAKQRTCYHMPAGAV